MPAKLFRISLSDLGNGLLVAVFTAVLVKLAAVINVPGFSFATYDWSSLISVAISSGIGYISNNFVRDSEGTILGRADR